MRKIITYTALLTLGFNALAGLAKAQTMSDVSTQFISEGVPKTASKETHYEDLEGSPYVSDVWMPGEAKLSDGKTYTGLLLKFDEIAGMLIFKYTLKDSAMAFKYPPVEFKFSYITSNRQHDVHFVNGFDAVDGADASTFYQVFNDGKIRLLKKTVKKIVTYTQFNSAAISRRVVESSSYYIVKDKLPVKIKTDKKSVLAFLNDVSGKIQLYIAENSLDTKKEEDLIKIIDYYNALSRS